MNEKIRELLVQSSKESIDGKEYPNWVDQEKFAKLIIKRCVSIINTWSEEEPCSAGYDVFTVSKIKEHFGIKE